MKNTTGQMVPRRSILLYGSACALLALVCFVAVAPDLASAQSFVGPCASPPSTCSLLVASSTRALGFGTSTIYSTQGTMTFRTNGGTNQHILFYPNGNVGIATTTPAEKLTVGGNIRASSFIGGLSGALAAGNVSSDVFGRLQGNGNFAFPASLGIATTSQNGLPQPLSVYGNAYVSGNVGIGTASPQAALHVNGQILFTDATAASKYGVGRWDYSGLAVTGLFANNGYANAAIGLGFDNSGTPVPAVTILKNGNVGIGTAAPATKLHIVRGTSAVDYPILLTNDDSAPTNLSGAGIEMGRNNTPWARIAGQQQVSNDYNFGKLTFGTRTSDVLGVETKMTILANGNVGIGTTTPTEKLEVVGNVKATAFIGALSSNISAANVSSDVFGRLQGNGNFAFPASLGIGTNSQAGLPQALSVYGNAYVSGNLQTNGIGGGNRIANSSIELGVVNGAPTAFNAGPCTKNAETARSGSYALKCVGPGSRSYAQTDKVWVDPSKPYVFSVWYQSSAIGTNFTFSVEGFDASNAHVNYYSFGTPATSTASTWQFHKVEKVPGYFASNVAYIKIWPDFINSPYTGTIWLDDMQFEEGTANTDWTPAMNHKGYASVDAAGTEGDYYFQNNVGVGTPSPTIESGVGIHVSNTGGQAAVRLTGSARSYELQTGGGSGFLSVKDITAGTSRLYIDNNGYVGIGTTTPQANLHVNGTAWFKDDNRTGAQQLPLKLGNFSNSPTVAQHMFYTTDSGDQALTFYANRWQGTWAWKRGGSTGDKYSAYIFSVDGSASYMNIYDANNGATVKLHAGGASYFNGGNLGIGTTTPGYALSVVGSMYSDMEMKGNSGSAITIDWSQGNEQHVILTASPVTLTFTNPKPGARYTLLLRQDAAGSKTVSWPGTVRWPGGTAVTLTSVANKTDYVGFMYNGYDSTYDNIAFNANF